MIAKAIANSLCKQIERNSYELEVALDLCLRLSRGEQEADIEELYTCWLAIDGSQLAQEAAHDARKQPRMPQLRAEVERFLRGRGIAPERAEAELRKLRTAQKDGARSYFISIKGPELLSKWVGETESSIRGIFAMARARATFYTPVIMFFDELESMFSRRGSGISSDVQKTIVPQLLAEMDGIEASQNVVIIGASNRFDLIDPAVLRPGRLDFKIEIPRPNRNREAPRSILARYLTPDLPLPPALPGEDAAGRLGPAAGQMAGLADALNFLLAERLNGNGEGLEAALFVTDVYKGRQPPVRKLHLSTTLGLDPDLEAEVIAEWSREEGPAWAAVRSDRAQSAALSASRTVAAWPLSGGGNTHRVWGALVVAAPTGDVERLRPAVEALAGEITGGLKNRYDAVGRLIERLLDLLFDDDSSLIIAEKVDPQMVGHQPRTVTKQVRDILTGAILESIVARAKRSAVKREIMNKSFGSEGITWNDLYEAVKLECEENKDQYVYELYAHDPGGREGAYHDADSYSVEVRLPPPDVAKVERPWLASKAYAWRRQQHVLSSADDEGAQ